MYACLRAHIVTYKITQLRTHLILGYFLCCCIVTAPKDGEGDLERGKGQKEREKAEVEVI